MSLLNLNKKLEENRRKKRSRTRVYVLGLFILLIVLFFDLYISLRGIYSSVKVITADSKVLQPALKTGDFTKIQGSLIQISQEVGFIQNDLNYLVWLKAIPIVNKYYNDSLHFSAALNYELQAANIIVKNLEPYQSELGLNGQPIAGQDKIAQGVKVLNKILPHLSEIEPDLKQARNEMEQVDVSSYPVKYGTHNLRSNLQFLKDFIIGTDIALENDQSLISDIPSALGTDTPKTYLMLFQNDKELRATGGFITAYAFLKIDKGHLSTTESSDIYKLDQKLLDACQNKVCPLTPPKAIAMYLPDLNGRPRTAWSLRDSNFSPDLPTSAGEFEKMYSYLNSADKVNFDGIIVIDTNVVKSLIDLTGPITLDGVTYSANMDARCNCANVIYELEHYAEVAAKGDPSRKSIVGTLMQEILSRVLGISTTRFPDVITSLVTLANHKDIMFYMHNPSLEEGLSKLNWTGKVAKTTGDYLMVNDSNFAGGKSNLYVEETVTDNITINNDQVKHNLVIKYENPQPFTIWLNGILRDYVRIYTPYGSKLVDSSGSEARPTSNDDKSLDKTFFDGFLEVRPQNFQLLSYTYTSSYKPSNGTYNLLIQKQPGSKDHHYIININGQKKADFNLTGDQNLTLTY